MRIRELLLVIILATCVVGCEKEIDIDYRSVEKMYVINSYTNSQQSYVSITLSTDMDEVMSQSPIEATRVEISDSKGDLYPLTLQDDGSYTSTELTAQLSGENFTLIVEIDGECYSSSSEVISPPIIISDEIFTTEIMGINAYFYNIIAQRAITDEDSYYKYELFVEDERILWGVYMQDADNDMPLTFSIPFASDMDGETIAMNSDKSKISIGDEILVNIIALDSRGYDYFNTLSLASQVSSNPVENFSGGALGVYSAFVSNSTTTTF